MLDININASLIIWRKIAEDEIFCVQIGQNYVIENVKISLQPWGIILLVSTWQTILIEEVEFDNMSFESFEASDEDLEMGIEERKEAAEAFWDLEKTKVKETWDLQANVYTSYEQIEDVVETLIERDKTVLSYADVLQWKIPKQMASNSTNADSYKKIWLFYYDWVTTKLKFEDVNIVGIIQSIQIVSPLTDF